MQKVWDTIVTCWNKYVLAVTAYPHATSVLWPVSIILAIWLGAKL